MKFLRFLKQFLKQSIIPLTVFLGFFLLLPTTSHAAYMASNDQQRIIVLPKAQTIAGDYFAYGHQVTIDGTVDGDVYALGGTVFVNGTVYGDVLAAGGVVHVQGKVLGNVRALAGNVIIDGQVGRNVTLFAGNATIADAANLSGSLTALTGDLSVFGPVALDAHIASGHVTLGSSIGRNVVAYVGQLIVASNASIKGTFSYISRSSAEIQQGAAIIGKINHTVPQEPTHAQQIGNQIAKVAVVGKLIGWLSTLLLGFLFIHFLPVYTKKITIVMEKQLWKSLGLGVLGFILIPLIAILFLVTLIGLPIGILLFILFFVFLYIAKLLTMVFIGETLLGFLRASSNKYLIFTVGMFAYIILSIVPIVGFLLHLLVLAGLGGLLWEEKIFYKQLRSRNSI